jgi:MFS family permease
MGQRDQKPWSRRLPFYYGWLVVVLAAAAMVATLPGRTHGLGMITERLLQDPAFDLTRVGYGTINLWATLLGALFCLPFGRLIDRWGVRAVLTGVVLGLAAVVLVMTRLTGVAWLFVAILFTRGLGQSALSVVSLAMVGKWFARRLSVAMGVYSVLVGLGFMGAFQVARQFHDGDWRTVWAGMGWVLLVGMVPLGYLLVRDGPEACALRIDGDAEAGCCAALPASTSGHTLGQALRTPAFWVFGLASSLYGLIASGISLFNESILRDRGFDAGTYYDVAKYTTLVALASNFLGGWLLTRWPIGRLLAVAMAVLAAALVGLPQVQNHLHLSLYVTAMGMAGGIVTVVFFTIWGHAFGRSHLGNVQGAAQMLTVFASAVGPLLLAECKERTDSYTLMFYVLAAVAAAMAPCAWWVPVPRPTETIAIQPDHLHPGELGHDSDERGDGGTVPRLAERI